MTTLESTPAPAPADTPRYASRKFLLTSAMLATATVLLAKGLIDGATWSTATTWLMGLYMAGNAGVRVADGLRKEGPP